MLLPIDTIARSSDFEERAHGLALRPWQWDFLHAADGTMRVGELAGSCGLDFDTAIDLVRETEALGLVQIVTLSLDAYRAAAVVAPTPVAVASSPLAISLESEPDSSPTKKAVSVSFDSFSSTMLAAWDVPLEEPQSIAYENTHELQSERSHEPQARTEESFGIAPLSASYGQLFAVPSLEDGSDGLADRFDEIPYEPIEEPRQEQVAVPYDLIAEAAHAHVAESPYEHLAEAPNGQVVEAPYEHVAESSYEHVVEPSFRSVDEYPYEFVAEASYEQRSETPKSVSFSLSADSFGLPTEPYETEPFEARPSVAPDVAPARVQPHETSPHDGFADQPPYEAVIGRPYNDDLTGVVLRALGLRK